MYQFSALKQSHSAGKNSYLHHCLHIWKMKECRRVICAIRAGKNDPTCLFTYPLNSHEWPGQNFSLEYLYNIKQTSDENKENVN